jgi:hypothetical protein
MTCSEKCKVALVAEKNRKVKPPKPPKTPKPEKQRKPPPEPGNGSRSSFTNIELGLCRSILTSLVDLPICKCLNSEKKIRIEPIGNEFKATCEWCGFEAVTVGGQWVGCETIKVEKRKPIAYGRGGEET